jgi:branched-chain amino acid transport system substrate-binding protein
MKKHFWGAGSMIAAFVLAAGSAAIGCEKRSPAPVPVAANSEAAKPAESGSTVTPAPSEARPAEILPGSDDKTIRIGHYASMTGSEATFGVSTDNGIKLALEERNAAGGVKGKKIELITYDNQGKPQETVTVVTRLIQQDRVVAVLGEVASSRSKAGAPICQKYGVPMISPSSTNPDVTAIGDKIFRVCFIDPFQGFVGAKFAHDNLKFTKAATLYNRAQDYSTGLNQNFVDSFKKMGGEIVVQQAYGDGDNDFSAQLAAIREKNPDFIYVPGYYTEVVNIARQAKRLGIKAPLIGGDGWDSEELKNAGDALDGCFFSNHYSQEDTRPEVQAFVKKYKDKFGKIPDGLAALGYDSARLLFDAMDKAADLKGKTLAAAIAAEKGFPGVTGKITIDKDRNANKDAVMLRIENGVPKFAATVPAPTN